MCLILEECFISDEMELGLLTGLMQTSRLHLTNSTSGFSQLWKTSGKADERRNSFLRCEVFTNCPVDAERNSAFRNIWCSPGLAVSLLIGIWEHSFKTGCEKPPKQAAEIERALGCQVPPCWSHSWESSGILHALNAYRTQSQILETSQIPCSMDTRIHFSKSQWLTLLLSL